MKKTILVILISGFFTGFVTAQTLLEIYKNGPVKLVPVKSYGVKNNWESLFNLYYDTLNISENEREQYKKIIVAPDGAVFMSHKNRYEIWKFSPDGNFVKAFGVKGGKANQFPMLPTIQPVVDNKYIFTSDVNGRLKFFDLEGNYFKSITLNYMTGIFQPLNNGKILLEGNVMWNNKEPGTDYVFYRWRHIIVMLDIYTGKEKIVHDYFEDPNFKTLSKPNPEYTDGIRILPPGDKIFIPDYINFRRPVFTMLKDGNIIQSNRETGDVDLYNSEGKKMTNFKLDIIPLKINENDVQENFTNVNKSLVKVKEEINNMKNLSDSVKKQFIAHYEKDLGAIDRYRDINNYHPTLPYFSNIILDDESNLLVFEFTSKDEAESNAFNVIAYNNSGKKIARTTFVSNEYDLSFSESTFVILKGYVYAIAKLKNYKGMPLRLVKFKISN